MSRHAQVGERIYFYEHGDRRDPPQLALVTEVNDAGLLRCSVVGVGRLKLNPQNWMRHIDDEYWDSRRSEIKHRAGAWDFHPVEGPQWDKYIQMQKVRAAKKKGNDEEEEDVESPEPAGLQTELEENRPVKFPERIEKAMETAEA